jgi:hypothetical protein
MDGLFVFLKVHGTGEYLAAQFCDNEAAQLIRYLNETGNNIRLLPEGM